jgi:hypothetical protein
MENQSITVDGISYDLAQFTDEVKAAVGVYNAINLDLQKAQVEVLKGQAALQTIGTQIATAVRKELDAKKSAAETESAE